MRARRRVDLRPPDRTFLDLLTGATRVLLTGHEHPDGDCLGAQVALHHLLVALGKPVRIVNPDPPLRPLEFLRTRTPIDEFDPARGLPDADLIVLLDCADPGRLGRMRSPVESARAIRTAIDHHIHGARPLGAVEYLDETAPATGMLVHALYRAFDVPVGPAAAEGLFLSIVSDTGWFRYSNTTPAVLELACHLVDCGVDVAGFHDRLLRRNHPESVRFLADALGDTVLSDCGRFGRIVVDGDRVARANRIEFDLDALMEPIRSVDGVEVVAMLKAVAPGTVKVSLRSRGRIDVRSIASKFGGGGHHNAAGATIRGVATQVVDAVERAVLAAIAADGGDPR